MSDQSEKLHLLNDLILIYPSVSDRSAKHQFLKGILETVSLEDLIQLLVLLLDMNFQDSKEFKDYASVILEERERSGSVEMIPLLESLLEIAGLDPNKTAASYPSGVGIAMDSLEPDFSLFRNLSRRIVNRLKEGLNT